MLQPGQGPISLGEAPDQAAPDTQVWVFQGTRALERPRVRDRGQPRRDRARPRDRHADDVATTDTPAVRDASRQRRPPARDRRRRCVARAIRADPPDRARRLGDPGAARVHRGRAGRRWVISRALRPVARMTTQAAEWSDRDLDRRFDARPAPRRADAARLNARPAPRPPRGEPAPRAAPLGRALARAPHAAREHRRPSPVRAQAHAQDADGRRALEQVRDSADQMGRTLDTLIAAARAELDPHHATSDARDRSARGRRRIGNS